MTTTERDRPTRRRPPRNAPVYVISVAAELTGVHAQTLRNYERAGLVTPSRSDGGNRRYSDSDLARIERIIELTDAGLPLEGVRRVLELERRVAELTPATTALMTRRAAQLPPRSTDPSPRTRPTPSHHSKGAHPHGRHTSRI